MSMEETKTQPDGGEDEQTVNITITDPQGEEVYFKVKKSAKMRRLFQAYCKRVAVDPDTMRFFYMGTRVNDDSTPEELGIKDGSKIEAFVRQVAGH